MSTVRFARIAEPEPLPPGKVDAQGASGEGWGSAEAREGARLLFERDLAPANPGVPRASPASAR
ncbi:hypothetical protein LUTEI9C_140136 [Luteimonas sp. 9C]|nr:hypothetical protein LUTEI9C_140136 [Luteimonas sp. 9C]